MTYTTIIFIILATSTGIWGLFCIMRRPGWLSIFLFASVLIICYFSTVELMGRPKPIQYESAGYEIEDIIAWRMVYGQSIYLWVDVGLEEPIAYSLPWDEDTAESLQDAFKEAGMTDKVVAEENMLRRLIDGDDDKEIVFHVQPQEPPSPKNYDQ